MVNNKHNNKQQKGGVKHPPFAEYSNSNRRPKHKPKTSKPQKNQPNQPSGILSKLDYSTTIASPELPLPELLAPAGSFDAVVAAIKGGADAVYLGGKLFNARMNAKNFDDAAMKETVKLCHKNGVFVYVTLNTLLYDRELPDAVKYAYYLRNIGVDALIVADGGVARLIHSQIPDLPLHASTQMSGHNSESAIELSKLGFERMVCARELSGEDIKYLCENSPIEIEAFIHGALCVSRSGQCLMSSMIGGRSGNRGECAQPCRLPYNGGYPLSLKDACLATHITDLIDCGVASLKIEGRMKSPDYVYGVCRIYRRLLDERRNAKPDEIKELENIFSRSGFTDGYFKNKIDGDMLGVRRENDKTATSTSGKDAKFTPVSRVKKVDFPSESREIIEISEKSVSDAVKAEIKTLENAFSSQIVERHTARFTSPEQIPENAFDYFDEIYLQADVFEPSAANGIILPSSIHDSERAAFMRTFVNKARDAKHLLVGNIGHFDIAKKSELTLHGDYRLNVLNTVALGFYDELLHFEDVILSPELIIPQIRDLHIPKSVIVYGRIPLMTVEHSCGCEMLKDRMNTVFPIRFENEIEGMRRREVIYNCIPTWMADKFDLLRKAGIKSTHFIFSDESRKQCEDIVKAYSQCLPPKDSGRIRRIKESFK